MRYKFNQQAAIWTFCAVVIVFAVAVGVSRIQFNQSPNLIGSLIYGILGLFAAIITGLIVPKKRPNVKLNWDDKELNEKEGKK